MNGLRSDDRGLSELIGYVLAFSIVIASVSVVYTGGLGAVMEYQEDERERNAERAFVALAESLNDLQRGDAPARNGEIRLAQGRLSMQDGPTVSVVVNDSGGSVEVFERRVGALSYAVGNTRVAYITGGVLRENSDAGSIAAMPPFRCTDQSAVVSLVTLSARDASTLSGQGSVLIEAEKRSTRVLYPSESNPDPSSVTISFDENSAAWSRELVEAGWTQSGDELTCETDRVVVRRTAVSIDFL